VRCSLIALLALLVCAPFAQGGTQLGSPGVAIPAPLAVSWSSLAIAFGVFGDQQALTNAGTLSRIPNEDTCACGSPGNPAPSGNTECSVGAYCDPCTGCIGSWSATNEEIMRQSVIDGAAWGMLFAVTVGDDSDTGHVFDRLRTCESMPSEVQEEHQIFERAWIDTMESLGIPWVTTRGNHTPEDCYHDYVVDRLSGKSWMLATALDTGDVGNGTQMQAHFRAGAWNICAVSIDCGVTAAELATANGWVGCSATEPTLVLAHTSVPVSGEAACPSGTAPNTANFVTGLIGAPANDEIFAHFQGHTLKDSTSAALTNSGGGFDYVFGNGNLQQRGMREAGASGGLGVTPASSAGGVYFRVTVYPLWPNGDGTRGRISIVPWNPTLKNSAKIPSVSAMGGLDTPYDWCGKFGSCPL